MPTSREIRAEIFATAREHFGYATLRPGQEEAIRSLAAGRDTLVVQPTGAGKSAIYQIAGMLIQGVTVVVSPLIALQKDQVDSINARDAAEAVVVNSTLKTAEARQTFERIDSGEVEYIFLAPEQLKKPETLQRLENAGVSLFVVDEAHSISEWGHDFRPDYLRLGPAIERLGHPVVLAMTATASPEVRREIAERLGMENPQVMVHGFDRPNIFLRVDTFQTESDKLDALVKRVRWSAKPGIVYVATRRNAESVMQALAAEGVEAIFYHAGLRAKERDAIQQRFMEGNAEVIVATNAFGMGVDKADVRFVYHFDIDDSLDAYYQEVGRAGRDGDPAEAVLFYRPENIGVQKFRTSGGKLAAAQVEQVTRVLTAESAMTPKDLARHLDLSERKVETVIHRMEETGAVEILPTGEVRIAPGEDLQAAAEHAVEEQERHRRHRREKLLEMQQYADTQSCRRAFLLRYFGENPPDFCGACDNCERASAGTVVDPAVGTRREVS